MDGDRNRTRQVMDLVHVVPVVGYRVFASGLLIAFTVVSGFLVWMEILFRWAVFPSYYLGISYLVRFR